MTINMTFEKINATKNELLQHPMYAHMNTPDHLKIFMKHHVFAVWDFMSLLKKLQQTVTCLDVPWVPKTEPNYARFVNEIVLAEESDEDGQGGFCSHFELYVQAMREIGANTAPIETYLHKIKNGLNPFLALDQEDIPDSVSSFVKHNLHTALHGRAHEVAAAFFYGREDIIPDMFSVIIEQLEQQGQATGHWHYYLQRHIELDGDEHGPLAEKLLVSLCGEDQQKIEEAEEIAVHALQARIELWDGVLAEMKELGMGV